MTKNKKRVPTSRSALYQAAAAERMKEQQMRVKVVCDSVHFAFFGMVQRLPADLRGPQAHESVQNGTAEVIDDDPCKNSNRRDTCVECDCRKATANRCS